LRTRNVVLVAVGAVVALAWLAATRECVVCVHGTHLSYTVRGLRSFFACEELASEKGASRCESGPDAPIICVHEEPLLELTVRDKGALGPGFLGMAACEGLSQAARAETQE